MKQGKVIILGGNARSGKTTLAIMLSKKNYSRISFDTLTTAIEEGLGINLDDKPEEILFKFFEIIVNNSIEDAKNYGVNTVIDMYDFLPEQVSRLKNQKDISVYFLAYPGFSKEEIKYNVKHYAKPTDWIAQVTDEYLDECAERFYLRNSLLQKECEKYNCNFIDTSAGEDRGKILNSLFEEILHN